MNEVARRLEELGIVLPKAAAPVANYVPFVRSGNLLIVSGQLPFGADGMLADAHKGKLGQGVGPEEGVKAARLCAINLLAQVLACVGDLDAVRCLRLGGFINADPSFAAIAPVMNGASNLMVAVLGDKGRHARSTIGVAELPMGAAVEVEGMFEIA